MFLKTPARKLWRGAASACFFCFVFLQAAAARAATDENAPNVILVVVSALRADHLGCYGYSRGTSPRMDQLVEEGVVFDQAITQSYWTLPSLVSLMTSRHVSSHGVIRRDMALPREMRTLPEILAIYGYETAAFTSGLDTAAAYGFDRGFSRYDVYRGREPVGGFADVMPGALRWLRKNGRKKFFMFLHSYDVHPPYKKSRGKELAVSKSAAETEPIDYPRLKTITTTDAAEGEESATEEATAEITGRYDEGIRRADHWIGRLLDELKASGVYERTLIVLCADHGEELGERGTFDRFGNQNLYQEVIRVPLIVSFPPLAQKGRRGNSFVELVDIAPTILELAAIPPAHDFEGRSLASFLREEDPRMAKSASFVFSEASAQKWAVLSADGWKLLYGSGRHHLYNLNDDPGERRDQSLEKPEMVLALMKEFLLWRGRREASCETGNRIRLNPQMIRKLRQAGYW